MKRPLTFSGFLISLIACAVAVILNILITVSCIAIFDLAGALGVAIVALVVNVISLAFNISVIALSSVVVANAKKDTETFMKKKGSIITAIVLNFIQLALLLILMILFSGIATIIIGVLVMIALIVANILALVGFAREKGGKTKEKIENTDANNEKQLDTLEEKITKLNLMKESGLISDEEYNALKQTYIQEQLSK